MTGQAEACPSAEIRQSKGNPEEWIHGHRGSGHEDVGLAKVVSAARLMKAPPQRNRSMTRIRNFLPLAVAALIGAAILGAPTQANAAFQLALQEAGINGGAITVVSSGSDFQAGGITFSGVYGDFTVSILGGTSNNGALQSNILSSTTSVTNNDGAGKTLNLFVTQTNYTLPTGTSLAVESGLGGSLIGISTVTLAGIFQAYADKNNNALGLTDFTNGTQTATQSGTTYDTGSAVGAFTRLATPYSLTSVARLTISAGGTVNYSDHVNVTATPEPATVVLALTGLPVLGIGSWLRRRKVKTQDC